MLMVFLPVMVFIWVAIVQHIGQTSVVLIVLYKYIKQANQQTSVPYSEVLPCFVLAWTDTFNANWTTFVPNICVVVTGLC